VACRPWEPRQAPRNATRTRSLAYSPCPRWRGDYEEAAPRHLRPVSPKSRRIIARSPQALPRSDASRSVQHILQVG
jgi:hypothetical protein